MKLNKRLCKNCKKEFQKTSPLQSVCSPVCAIERSYELNKAKREKEVNDKVEAMRPNAHAVKYKGELQKEINLLARKIDAKFGYECIDLCGKPYGSQTDGAHKHSVGSNSTLRFNLHNIHSARSDCNKYSPLHQSGYLMGLIKRYGQDYADKVENLPSIYKGLKLTNNEIVEKLALVRKINRTFDTYLITSGDTAREMFNALIGIYN